MWEPFKIPQLSGMNGWATADGQRSYVISFDTKHPTLGYRLSVRPLGGDAPVYESAGIATLKDAKAAARRYMRQVAN